MKKLALVMVLCLALLLPCAAMAQTHADHTGPDCLACRIVSMINALPAAQDVTIDNAAGVIEQIHAIDRIKFDLTDDAYWDAVHPVVQRYHDAVEAAEKLGGGGWLAIGKKFAVVGMNAEALDLSKAQVQFSLTKNDDPSWAAQTLTLSTLFSSPIGYEAGTNGWTYRYQLPAGTYTLTENTSLPAVIGGQELYTSSVAANGKAANAVTFSIENGKETPISFLNSYKSFAITNLSVDGGTYDQARDTVTLTEGKPFSIMGHTDATFQIDWEWQLLQEADSVYPEETTLDKNPYQGTANLTMDGMYLKVIARNGMVMSAEKTVQLIVEKKTDVPVSGSSIPSVPKTGDATPIALLTALCAMSGLCLIQRRRSA